MPRDAKETISTPSAISYSPIGVIHSPHTLAVETPIQPVYARGIEGIAEIFPNYVDGLCDLEGFSHLYLLVHFHQARKTQLMVKPFLDDTPRGVFATRSPRRPNPIGLSVVQLVGVEGHVLHLKDVDLLDGTPLLDIKPYVPRFDLRQSVRIGWQEAVDEEAAQIRGRRQYREK